MGKLKSPTVTIKYLKKNDKRACNYSFEKAKKKKNHCPNDVINPTSRTIRRWKIKNAQKLSHVK